ncbi:MAG: thioredoxin domain-containing protein [Ferruginibacter sp.]
METPHLPQHQNLLIHETSPYLLQHAHNPVHWYPWGEAALKAAQEEQKVILVSIGYSACHWCHVMERESFENESIAAFMNDNFINIKVDREERPDIDHIYMDAVQAMTGSGGWPLNVFLTPDLKPFYGGTYFPPERAFNRASWIEILNGIAQSWKEKRNDIEAQAENLTNHLKQSNHFIQTKFTGVVANTPPAFTKDECMLMAEQLMKTADKEWGGFGHAPKFPQTFVISFLIQYAHLSGDQICRNQALLSVNKMLDGGIFDQVQGGFARYSTDNAWLVPHFEKMLYDNALLLQVLCDALILTKHFRYEEAIKKTVNFLLYSMQHSEGGFYAALDADSEGVEGKFYVWDQTEINTLLEEDAELFCTYYNVSEKGNWEGVNILNVQQSVEVFAEEQKLSITAVKSILDRCLQKLFTAREKRTKPGLDDKIILSWNALLISALAKASRVLQDVEMEAKAVKIFHFITTQMVDQNDPEALLHTWKKEARHPAFLEDYAYFIDACLELYECSFDAHYIQVAKQYATYVEKHFSDETELFFYFTHQLQENLIVRKKEVYDGATPSGNAIMAKNLFKLGILLDRKDWMIRSERMLEAMSAAVIKYPSSFGIWSTLLLYKAYGMHEIAIVGPNYKSHTTALTQFYIPNKIIMASKSANEYYPLLQHRGVDELTAIYLCSNYACFAPVFSVDNLMKSIC